MRLKRQQLIFGTLPARGAESFDCIKFTLFHQSIFPPFHNGHRLAGVDVVAVDGVAVEVGDALYLVCLAVDLDLVTFHGLLNSGTDFTEACVNTRFTNASFSGSFGGFDQVLVTVGVERECERTVNDAPVDLSSVIKLD